MKVLHHETGSHLLITEHCQICAKVPKHKRTQTCRKEVEPPRVKHEFPSLEFVYTAVVSMVTFSVSYHLFIYMKFSSVCDSLGPSQSAALVPTETPCGPHSTQRTALIYNRFFKCRNHRNAASTDFIFVFVCER